MGKAEAGAAVALLASAYPAARFDDQLRVETWVRMLEDLEPEALVIAVKSLICTAKFCPSIAEIRSAVLDVTDPDGQVTGAEAWGQVLNEIARVGWCGNPDFGDRMVRAALQCTANWRDLCTTDVCDMPPHRARFIAVFDNMVRRRNEGLLLPDSLLRQIENREQEFLKGTLDDARGHLGEGEPSS